MCYKEYITQTDFNKKWVCGNEREAKRLFEELPFYNPSIEKPYIKCLNNIDMLGELTFYKELSIAKTLKVFRRYARSHGIEIINSKDPSVQLTISKQSMEDLFKDEIKAFE